MYRQKIQEIAQKVPEMRQFERKIGHFGALLLNYCPKCAKNRRFLDISKAYIGPEMSRYCQKIEIIGPNRAEMSRIWLIYARNHSYWAINC